MIYKIYCLMGSGIPVDDEIRSMLFHVSRNMLKTGKEKVKIKNDSLEGLVTTDFEIGCLGCVAGVMFNAEIDTDKGSGKVRFITNTDSAEIDDWENACWMDAIIPNFDLQEAPENHPALHAMNN